MKQILLALASAIFFSSISMPASADFVITKKAAEDSKNYESVVEIGNISLINGLRPSEIFHGMGKGVPLREAAQMIAPYGYSINNGNLPEAETLVSWDGGKNWVEVLDGVLSAAKVGARIDMRTRVIKLTKRQEKKIEVAATSTEGGSSPAVSSKLETPVAPPLKEWVVEASDGYVSTSLAKWGKVADYDVVWESPKDFRISTTKTIFKGTFESAVNQVVESLSISDSPVRAIFHPNRVVQIVRYDGQTSDLINK